MSRITFAYILLPILAFFQPCEKLPTRYSSFEEAIQKVRSHSFNINESDFSKSSWIKSAAFKSCDGKVGYFILHTNARVYIHSKVPIEVWRGYKRAGSKGSFYDSNLKGRYRIPIKLG